MTEFLDRSGLSVDSRLADFVEARALPGTGLDTAKFWSDFAALLGKFAPENAALLARREDLQAQIDAWHQARQGIHDPQPIRPFLRESLSRPEPQRFRSEPNVIPNRDDGRAATRRPRPQARFALTPRTRAPCTLCPFYGTDTLERAARKPGGYDAARGAG